MAGTVWTPERREAASKAAKERYQAALQGAVDNEQTAAEEIRASDAALREIIEPIAPDDVMDAMIAALQSAKEGKAERAVQIAQLERALGAMKATDYPELASNPVVQSFIEALSGHASARRPGDPPGTIYNRGMLNESKKRWQWSDLAKYFPAPGEENEGAVETVEVTPNETITVTWNGLPWVFHADVTQWVPRPHWNAWMDMRAGRETAKQHAEVMFNQRNNITGIADPSVLNQSTAMVRGRGNGAIAYKPGAGGFNPFEPEEVGAK